MVPPGEVAMVAMAEATEATEAMEAMEAMRYRAYGPGSRGGIIRGSAGGERSRKEGLPTNSGKSTTQLLEEKQSTLSEYLEMIGPSSEQRVHEITQLWLQQQARHCNQTAG